MALLGWDRLWRALDLAEKAPDGSRMAISVPDGTFIAVRFPRGKVIVRRVAVQGTDGRSEGGGEWMDPTDLPPTIVWRPA